MSEEVQQQAEPEAQYATEEMSEEMLVEEVLAVLEAYLNEKDSRSKRKRVLL